MADEYLYNQVMQTEEIQQENIGLRQISALLDPKVFPANDAEAKQKLSAVRDKHIEAEVDEGLATGTLAPERAQELSDKYQGGIDYYSGLDAAVEETASSLPKGQRENLKNAVKQYDINHAGPQYAIKRLKDFKEAWRTERLDKFDTGFAPLSALAVGASAVPAILDAYALGGFGVQVGELIRKFDPDGASVAESYLHGEAGRRRITQLITTLPSEQSKKLVDELFEAVIKTKGAKLLKSNPYTMEDILSQFISPIENGESWISMNVLQPLDYVDVIPLIGPLKKGLVSGVTQVGRFFRGSAADKIIRSPEAADRIVEALKSADASALLKEAGVTEAQVVGELLVPKMKGEPLSWMPKPFLGEVADMMKKESPELAEALARTSSPSGRPFLDPWVVGEEQLGLLAGEAKASASRTFGNRLSDWQYEITDDGLRFDSYIGSGNGLGWATEAEAKGAALLLPEQVPHKVVKDAAGNWQLKLSETLPLSVTHAGVLPADSILTKWHGFTAAARLDETLIRAANTSVLLTAKEKTSLLRMSNKARRLVGKEWGKVAKFLEDRDKGGFVHGATRQDMLLAGLSEKGIKAAEQMRDVFHRLHVLSNAETYEYLKLHKYVQWNTNGGRHFIREMPLVEVLSPAVKSGKAIDMATGKVTHLSKMNLTREGLRVYEMAEDISGVRYVFAKKGVTPDFSALPFQVEKYNPNWVPRHYNSPVFIREIAEDGTRATKYTAQSVRRASEWVAEANRKAGYEKYTAHVATELGAGFTTKSAFHAARENGLLITSHRNPLPLKDVDGLENMLSLRDSLNLVINSAAYRRGLGRMGLAMKAKFDATFKDIGWRLGDVPPDKANIPVDKLDMYNEAKRLDGYLSTLLGYGKHGAAGHVADLAVGSITDMLFEASRVARVAGITDVGTGAAARELSGLSPVVVMGLKSVVSNVLVVSNFIAQAILQPSSLLVNAGVDGGMRYLFGMGKEGSLLTDLALLTAANAPEKLEMMRKAYGMSTQRMEKLLADYRAAGLADLVHEHLAVLNSLSNTRYSSGTAVGKAVGDVGNVMKAIGINTGISIEKKAAWLYARNRALLRGEKLDAHGLKKVAQDAEMITANQSRVDPLTRPDGLVSLYTHLRQFPLKMMSRTASVVTGGKYGKEAGLKWAEQARMLALSGVWWGAEGYGAYQIVDYLDEKYQWGLDAKAKHILSQGIQGSMIANVLSGWSADADELMVSKRFSPFNIVGEWAYVAKESVATIAEAAKDPTRLADLIPDSSVFGVVGSVWDATRFAYNVYGGLPEEPFSNKTVAVATEYLKTFPLVSNYLRYQMAKNVGARVAADGTPIHGATQDSLRTQLLGIMDKRTYGILKGQEVLFGKWDADRDVVKGDLKEIDREAQNTFYLLKKYHAAVMGEDGWETRRDEMWKFIEGHNALFFSGLDEEQHRAYMNALTTRLNRDGMFKDEAFLERITRNRDTPLSASTEDRLRGLHLPVSLEEIKAAIEPMYKYPDLGEE